MYTPFALKHEELLEVSSWKEKKTEQTRNKILITMQHDTIKDIVAEIGKQAISTQQDL